jgi:hypothetical protein
MSRTQALRVIKSDREEKPAVIRPELNLEQWLLWQPANARGKERQPIFEAKVLEKELVLSDGTTVTARVTADYTSFGALTTEDQKTLYGLVKIWEGKGEEYFNQTYFSIALLLKALKRKRGGNSVPALIKSLRRLRSNPIHLEHSFLDAESGERVSTIENPVTILAELKIIQRAKHGKPVRDAGYFKFHPLILKNLAQNYRKPVLIDVVLSLKGDVSQLIYSYIDRQLTNAEKFKIRSENLFREIGLERASYRYLSKRKETLERALSELPGKLLSGGGLIRRAALEPTKDRKDFNIIFEKGARVRALPSPKAEEKPGDELIRRLQDELLIMPEEASICAERRREMALKVLDAKEYFPDWKSKTGGFWFLAITTPYKLPPAYLLKREKLEEKQTSAGERERKAKADAEKKAREEHREKFTDRYHDYLRPERDRIEREFPDEYKRYSDFIASHRTLNEISALRRERVALAFFEDFVEERPELGTLTFWQWDKERNLQPFRDVPHT